MTERIEKLRATIKELEAELAEVDTLDDETQQLLEEALGEILERLVEPPAESRPEEEASLGERLTAAAERFEASHPALNDLLNRLIVGLNQLGI